MELDQMYSSHPRCQNSCAYQQRQRPEDRPLGTFDAGVGKLCALMPITH